MARVLRGFAPEPPVVFVILSEAKYLMLCSLGLTPHPSPLLKERENAVGSASVPRRGELVCQIPSY